MSIIASVYSGVAFKSAATSLTLKWWRRRAGTSRPSARGRREGSAAFNGSGYAESLSGTLISKSYRNLDTHIEKAI